MNIPSKEDYDKASPWAKGFMAYFWSARVEGIPPESKCPFAEGTEDHTQFQLGVRQAVLAAQDSEE